MKQIAYIFVFLLVLLSTAGIFFFYVPIRTVHFPYLIAGGTLIFAIYIHFYKSLFSLQFNRQVIFLLSSACILAVLFLLSTRGQQDYLEDNSFLVILLVYFGSFLIVAVILALMFLKLIKSGKTIPTSASGWDIAYFLLPFATGLGYFLAFYPAVMTSDSTDIWNQVQTLKFNNWHPVMYSWTILLLTFIWNSPGIISLFQNFILALIFAYSFWQFRKLGVSRILLLGMCLIITLIPSYGIYTVTMWKDVLYGGSLTLFTVHLFLIIYSQGDWFRSKVNIVFFFLSSFGVVFFRHNGFPVYVLTMIILLIIFRKQVWKTAGSIFLILVIFHQLLVGPIFHYLHVVPSDPNEALAIPTQQIAIVIKNDGILTAAQRNYFNQILPISEWKQNYHPQSVDQIKFSKNYNREVIYNDFPKYLKTWAEVVMQNPSFAKEAFLQETNLVWKMSIPTPWTSLTYHNAIDPNKYGLTIQASDFTTSASKYLSSSIQLPYVFLWRPALFAFIVFVFSILLFAKYGWKSSVVILPFLLNMLSVAVALPAQDFRYLFANVLISFVVPLMALTKPKGIEDMM